MNNYHVVKASTLHLLKKIIAHKVSQGLVPLGSPSLIHMRNKINQRMAVYYQSMAFASIEAR